jgi:hypothetical protein
MLEDDSTIVPLGRLGTPDEIAKAVIFSPPMMQVTSQEQSCLLMEALRTCRPVDSRIRLADRRLLHLDAMSL